MKQRAVEWLIERIEDTSHDLHHLMKVRGVFDQAKAMEKEQIIDANRNGVDMVIDKKPFITGEQYYNETYGK